MSPWAVGWCVWVLWFFAEELPAILNKQPGDTLSEQFRKVFHTNNRVGRWVWAITFGIFAAWFGIHIAVAGSM